MLNDYNRLITHKRRKETRQVGRDLVTEMLSDKGRIVTSAPFRRLQTKAQVFSLEQNAAVRSRLTHTMEVAFIGELIATYTFDALIAENLIAEGLRLPFYLTVQNACLLHDVGNPPFGHLGEAAIADWFSQRRQEVEAAWEGISDAEAHFWAFEHFDGNPQVLRIITRLQWLDNEFGLNPTYTLIAALLKYLGPRKDEKAAFGKKAGFFHTEREIIRETWRRMGLKTNSDGLPAQRHPLVFLMEAADDIAYCSSDIEDALEKEIITEKVFVYEIMEGELLGDAGEVKRVCEALGMNKFLDGVTDYREWCRSYQTRPERGIKIPAVFSLQNNSDDIRSPNALFVSFKVAVTNALVKRATKVYLENHTAILSGEFQRPLLDLEKEKILDFLREFAKKYIFTSKEAMNVELSGYHIVQGILDGFSPLLRLSSDEFANLPSNGKFHLEKRLYSLLSKKQLHAYFEAKHESAGLEPVLRAHLIVDYVSGMTDSHAVKTFNMLKGITS